MDQYSNFDWEGMFKEMFGHEAPSGKATDARGAWAGFAEEARRRHQANTAQGSRRPFSWNPDRPAHTAPTFDNTVGKQVCLVRDYPSPASVLRHFYLMPDPSIYRRYQPSGKPITYPPETPSFYDHMCECEDCIEGVCPVGEKLLRNVIKTVIAL
jgi:hypothetical protein